MVPAQAGRRRHPALRRDALDAPQARKGVCLVDGKPLDEPYVRLGCDWDIPPHKIRPGHIYVMGDNRSVPAEAHVGGEIAAARVVGRPLW